MPVGLCLCCLNINTKCASFEKEAFSAYVALQPPSYDYHFGLVWSERLSQNR